MCPAQRGGTPPRATTKQTKQKNSASLWKLFSYSGTRTTASASLTMSRTRVLVKQHSCYTSYGHEQRKQQAMHPVRDKSSTKKRPSELIELFMQSSAARVQPKVAPDPTRAAPRLICSNVPNSSSERGQPPTCNTNFGYKRHLCCGVPAKGTPTSHAPKSKAPSVEAVCPGMRPW